MRSVMFAVRSDALLQLELLSCEGFNLVERDKTSGRG